jgi:2-dehydro-3-deoxygalactonokinase
MSVSPQAKGPSATALIGIDWGTSQLRAFRISASGQALERRESPQGVAALRHGEFDQSLRSLISDWQPDAGTLPILMCGMIGSRQGWREAPYCVCPARHSDILDTLQPIDTSCGPAFVIGGLSNSEGDGYRDVMRGEETQIFGAVASMNRQLCVAPGTHSKWAVIDGKRIESFRTYMTGEMYGLLCKHSSLGWLMQSAEQQGHDDQAFLSGVHRALEDTEVLHALFSVRTKGLFDRQPPGALAAFLSGLLIGSETAGAVRQRASSPILVIASPELGRLYGLALAAAGIADIRCVDANQAVVYGLWQLWRLHQQEAT